MSIEPSLSADRLQSEVVENPEAEEPVVPAGEKTANRDEEIRFIEAESKKLIECIEQGVCQSWYDTVWDLERFYVDDAIIYLNCDSPEVFMDRFKDGDWHQFSTFHPKSPLSEWPGAIRFDETPNARELFNMFCLVEEAEETSVAVRGRKRDDRIRFMETKSKKKGD